MSKKRRFEYCEVCGYIVDQCECNHNSDNKVVVNVEGLLTRCREHKSDMYGIELSKSESMIVAEALDKYIIPKPLTMQNTSEKIHYKCPSCDTILMTEYKDGIIWGSISHFCKKCGQRLEHPIQL